MHGLANVYLKLIKLQFYKILEVYKNCVTQYFIFEKKIDYGNWLHNRLFVHGQTKTHYDLLVRFRTECK